MNVKDLTHFKADSNAVFHFEPNPKHRYTSICLSGIFLKSDNLTFFRIDRVRVGT